MEEKPILKPKKIVTSPDQRSQVVRLSTNSSGDCTARVRPHKVPEGFSVEKVGRCSWEISWQETITEPTKIVFGAENVAGTRPITCTLLPNEDELKLLAEKGEDAFA